MTIDFNEQLLEFIKIAAIFFVLVHFLAGAVLVQQMYRMNNIIKTANSGCFHLLSLLYMGLLFLVFILVVIS